MGSIVSKRLDRGYKVNDPGLSNDATAAGERQGTYRGSPEPSALEAFQTQSELKVQEEKAHGCPEQPKGDPKLQGHKSKAPDVPKKEQRPEISPDHVATTIIQVVKQVTCEDKIVTAERLDKPEPILEKPSIDLASYPVIKVLKSSAEAAAKVAPEMAKEVSSSQQKDEAKNKEEPVQDTEKRPAVPDLHQPAADKLKSLAETASTVSAGELNNGLLANEAPPPPPMYQPVTDVLKSSAASAACAATEFFEKVAPEGEEKHAGGRKPVPGTKPTHEEELAEQQLLVDQVKFSVMSDALDAASSRNKKCNAQSEIQSYDHDNQSDVSASTRAAVSFASTLIDSSISEDAAINEEPMELNTAEEPPNLTKAEAEAAAAKIVEEVKANAEKAVTHRLSATSVPTVENGDQHSKPADADALHHHDRSPTPNEIESAVVKIQARVRGYLTRKQLHEKSPQRQCDKASQRTASDATTEQLPKKITVSGHGPNLVTKHSNGHIQDHRQTTQEEEFPAARRVPPRGADGLIGLDSPIIEEAATKIQAAFRGYKVRKEMKPDNGPHGLHKGEVSL